MLRPGNPEQFCPGNPNAPVRRTPHKSAVTCGFFHSCLDEIYNERRREFAWEGLRRQDMIRFGKWTAARDLKSAESPAYTKLFPIPARVLETNSNLVQNDGYVK